MRGVARLRSITPRTEPMRGNQAGLRGASPRGSNRHDPTARSGPGEGRLEDIAVTSRVPISRARGPSGTHRRASPNGHPRGCHSTSRRRSQGRPQASSRVPPGGPVPRPRSRRRDRSRETANGCPHRSLEGSQLGCWKPLHRGRPRGRPRPSRGDRDPVVGGASRTRNVCSPIGVDTAIPRNPRLRRIGCGASLDPHRASLDPPAPTKALR